MEIQPATIDQMVKGKGGKVVAISSDVGNVAKDLLQLKSEMSLHVNEEGGFFFVQDIDQTGRSYIVTTSQDCDQRLVERVRKIMQPSYDLNKEAAKLEKQVEKDKTDKHHEEVGEIGQKLFHAMRKDLGYGKKNY